MSWIALLDEVFGSRAKVSSLRALWRSDGTASGREVARRSGLSHTGALAALSELAATGVVRRSSAVKTARFALADEHVLTPAVRAAFEAEAALGSRLVDFISLHCPGFRSIVMFGSAARGEDEPQSDLDVLVLVDDSIDADELNEVFAALDSRSRFGKHVHAHVWTLTTLTVHERARLPLLDQIWLDGRLLAGDDLDLVSWKARRVADQTRSGRGRKALPRESAGVPARRARSTRS